MKPIIKWAGGKRELAPKIKELMPSTYGTYYEPFLGGAAVLLDLNPTNAVVSDINPELINMYHQVQDRVENVINYLNTLDAAEERATSPKEFYYKVRENFNKNTGANDCAQAARFIYLNKHCFNGLYRVNSKGQFNVPFNGIVTNVEYCRFYDITEEEALKEGYSSLDELKDVLRNLYDVDADPNFTLIEFKLVERKER